MKTMWVGFAFFLGVLILGFATLMIKDISLLIGGERIVLFVGLDEAMGLEEGDDVRVDGIPIGKVKFVGLYDEEFRNTYLEPAGLSPELVKMIEERKKSLNYRSQGVAVVAELTRRVELRSSAQVAVEGLALIGGAFLSIKTGITEDPLRDMLKLEDRVLIGRAKKSILDSGTDLIEENRKTVMDTLNNLRDVTANLKDLTWNFNEGRGWLPEEIKGLRKDINVPLTEATEAIKKMAAAIDDIKSITNKINTGEGSIGKIISSDELYKEILATVKEAKDVIQSLKSGDGPLPAIINDGKMKKDVEETLQKINSAAGSLDNVIKAVEKGWLPAFMQDQKIGDDLKSSVSGLQNTIGRIGNAETFLRVENQTFNDSKTSVSRVAIHLWPTKDKTLIIGGVFMTFDPTGDVLYEDKPTVDEQDFTKLEVQLAYRIPWAEPVTFRAGMFEGKPGGAFDFDVQRLGILDWPIHVSMEARQAYDDLEDDNIDELVDTGSTLYRAYVRAALYKKPADDDGWFLKFLNAVNLTVGVNRLFSDNNEFFVGIGVHYEERDIKAVAGLAGGP